MSRHISKWLYLLIPLTVYGVGIFCALRYGTDWTEKQTWAVVLTGVVLIWYTWETMLLRRIAFVQRELQLRPFIVFRREAQQYVAENIGNAAALNIRFENVAFQAPGTTLEILFPRTLPLLKPGTTAEVTVEVKINGQTSDPAFAAHLDPTYAVEDVDIRIHFTNLEGKSYSLVEVVSPQNLSIKGFRDDPAL
jgi:hypothetical protein